MLDRIKLFLQCIYIYINKLANYIYSINISKILNRLQVYYKNRDTLSKYQVSPSLFTLTPYLASLFSIFGRILGICLFLLLFSLVYNMTFINSYYFINSNYFFCFFNYIFNWFIFFINNIIYFYGSSIFSVLIDSNIDIFTWFTIYYKIEYYQSFLFLLLFISHLFFSIFKLTIKYGDFLAGLNYSAYNIIIGFYLFSLLFFIIFSYLVLAYKISFIIILFIIYFILNIFMFCLNLFKYMHLNIFANNWLLLNKSHNYFEADLKIENSKLELSWLNAWVLKKFKKIYFENNENNWLKNKFQKIYFRNNWIKKILLLK